MKNSKLTSIILILSFIANVIIAQSSLKGNIKAENEALPYANAILLNPIDSSIVKGDISDLNGQFLFENLAPASYLLQISMIGYNDVYSVVDLHENEQMELSFELSPNATQLGEVTVVGKAPLFEQRSGKLVVNIADNISGINGSMKSALKKIPGVIVTNNTVSLNGNSSVTILIDGKVTEYMDINTLLNEMSADDIQRIEVSTQPDATLDASGTGGVINIILKKNVLTGTNGSVKVGLGYGKLAKYFTRVSLNHRNERVNSYAAVAYSHNSSFSGVNIERNFKDTHFVQTSYEPRLPNTYSAKFGVDYNLTNNQKIGIATKGLYSKNKRSNYNTTSIQNRTTYEESSVISDIDLDNNWNYFSSDAFYEYQLDTSGQKINLAVNWGKFNTNTNSFSKYTGSQIFFPNQKNNGISTTDIKVLTLDYEIPLTKEIFMKSGIKYSKAIVNNLLDAKIESEGVFVNQNDLTTHYIFDESIKAAYLQGSFHRNKIDFQCGLRFEQALATGYETTLDSSINRNITKLFPSASLTIPINNQLGWVTNYSYRIQRPSYGTLNPAIYQYDPYTYHKGNQYLNPELTHTLKTSLTYNAQPFFNLEYNHSNDALVFVTRQDNETGAAFATTENFDKHDQYTASLFFPLSMVKFLDGYGGLFTNYDIYKSTFIGEQYDKKQFSFMAFIQANAEISKSFHVEMTGWYKGKGLQGIMEHENMYGLSFGLEKTFLDDRMSLKVSVDDVLSKLWTAKIDYANMDILMKQRWEVQIANLELVYKFGNRYLKKQKNSRSAAEEEIQRAKAKS